MNIQFDLVVETFKNNIKENKVTYAYCYQDVHMEDDYHKETKEFVAGYVYKVKEYHEESKTLILENEDKQGHGWSKDYSEFEDFFESIVDPPF
tara:strand:+ start:18741 stop:19019 length:279 start_codon:yes stop_codon:yes gene_type:complete